MTSVQANQPPSDPGSPPNAGRRGSAAAPLSRPVGDLPPAGSGTFAKPRVKMLETPGDLNPAGATYTPPTPAPLPARGAGLHLFLSVLAALAAVVFLILLAQKL